MTKKIYELPDGIDQAKKKIKNLKRKTKRPFLVAIAGPTCSGKTTRVAEALESILPNSRILHIDDYFRGRAFMKMVGTDNFDDPISTDLDLLAKHLKMLKKNMSISKPVYSFKAGERQGCENFDPAEIIIVEGLYALYDSVVAEMDFKIFVEISVHGSLIRRILSYVGKAGQTEEDIFRQIVENVCPMNKLHVEPTKSLADIIIVNEYDPEVEAECCEVRDMQIKADVGQEIPWRNLLVLGFQPAGTCYQEDTYYAAPHWQPPYAKELMRIRKEGNKYFVAYKGPSKSKSGQLSIRSKIEFEVEPFLKDALERLGYKKIMDIKKQRTKMFGQNLELAVDRIEGNGNFFEFRTSDPNGESQIMDCFKQLGIDKKSITKKSYLELMLDK